MVSLPYWAKSRKGAKIKIRPPVINDLLDMGVFLSWL
jgi:hypothetical protein